MNADAELDAGGSEVVFEMPDLDGLPAPEAVEVIVRQAVELRASDLYILSEEESATVAVRRLGTIEKLATISREQGGALIRSMKANSGMDIAETRRPLDGRAIHDIEQVRVDLRMNSIPTLFGEDLTCRLLDRTVSLLNLDALGMSRGDSSNLTAMLTSPSGLILVTGPTGTGKTTTLYACLQHLNDGSRKINTLEDPIEYAIPGIRQSQVNTRIKVNFSNLLPSVLRQSPDVIMIGEIRDEETAQTAVRAANSGHLVLATLHAPIAAGAVQSMLALEVKPYFLASCLLCVIAQRLIRTLCPHCRVQYDLSFSPQTFEEIDSLLEEGQGQAMYGPGRCDQCFENGYAGRTGLFEVMTLNKELRKLVADARPSREIEQAAINHGMIEFRRAALLKVAQGVTSTEEMLRAVPSEYLGLED